MKAGSEFVDCKSNVVGRVLKFDNSYLNGVGIYIIF